MMQPIIAWACLNAGERTGERQLLLVKYFLAAISAVGKLHYAVNALIIDDNIYGKVHAFYMVKTKSQEVRL